MPELFVMGFGLTSCVYLAPPILVNRWFSKRSGFFIGVIASSFIGGTIVNVAGSYLAMFAFIGTALIVACLLLVVAARLQAR